MEVHANAALSLNARRRLARRVVEQGWSLGSAAAAAEVSERTARKWAQRYREEGEAGLLDRSSAPKRVWNRTCERRIEAIAALRRLRMTAAQIAACLGDARADCVGDPDPHRHGPTRPPGARAGAPLRALAAGRARAR